MYLKFPLKQQQQYVKCAQFWKYKEVWPQLVKWYENLRSAQGATIRTSVLT